MPISRYEGLRPAKKTLFLFLNKKKQRVCGRKKKKTKKEEEKFQMVEDSIPFFFFLVNRGLYTLGYDMGG